MKHAAPRPEAAPSKSIMLCLPGLGGDPISFRVYDPFFPEYELKALELVDREKTLDEARMILSEAPGPIPLFCHCYAIQMGIQLSLEMPEKVEAIIVLEPFFSEFQPWMKWFVPVTRFLLAVVRAAHRLGIRRRRFTYHPDYAALAKYPIYIQPVFDMRWQSLEHYLDKCYDILTYRLPPQVEVSVTMVFSPYGFLRDAGVKAGLKRIFRRLRIVDLPDGTHNVMAMDIPAVAAAMRQALAVLRTNSSV